MAGVTMLPPKGPLGMWTTWLPPSARMALRWLRPKWCRITPLPTDIMRCGCGRCRRVLRPHLPTAQWHLPFKQGPELLGTTARFWVLWEDRRVGLGNTDQEDIYAELSSGHPRRRRSRSGRSRNPKRPVRWNPRV